MARRILDWTGWISIFYLIVGSLIAAVAINGILAGNALADGGLTGLSLVIHYLSGIGTGPLYFILNVPLFLFGWRYVGRTFFLKTVLGVVLLSFFLTVTGGVRYPIDDQVLATLYAGGLVGLGLGLMFRSGGSSGGVDVVAQFLRQRHGIPIGDTFLVLDTVILGLVWYVLGTDTVLYSLVVTFIGGRVIDAIQDGPRRGKMAYILCRRPGPVRHAITENLKRGATVLPVRGSYSDEPNEMLIVVVRRGEVGRLKAMIAEIDPDAFVIIGEVAEVLGEGFDPIRVR